MKKVGLYILIATVVLCAVALDYTLVDRATPIRNIIWCIATIVLVLVVMFARRLDFGGLGNPMVPAYAVYFLVTAFSMTRAINVSESFYGTSVVYLSLVFLIAAILFLDRRTVAKAITVLALLFGLYGFWFLVVSPFYWQTGTMGNRNLWSSALFLLLPFCVFAMRYWWRIGLLAALLITANLILLSTRSVMVGLFVFAITLALCYGRTFPRGNEFVRLGLRIIALLIVANLTYRFNFNTTSLQQRFTMWSASAEMIRDRPLGVGAGNWSVTFPYYCSAVPDMPELHTKIFTRGPHNDFFWVFSELGVIGGAAYLAIFAVAVYNCIKGRNYVILAGILGFALGPAFFSFPKSRAFLLLMSLLLMAMTIEKRKPLYISRRKICLAGSLVIVGLSVVLFGFCERYRMDRHARIIRYARKQSDWETVAAHTKRMSWFYTLDSTTMPMWFYKGEASFYAADTTEALVNFLIAFRHNPSHVHNLNNMATCLALHGLYEESITCLNRALKIRPGLPVTLHNLKAVYLRMGVDQKEEKWL